jgi:hypothetical protein
MKIITKEAEKTAEKQGGTNGKAEQDINVPSKAVCRDCQWTETNGYIADGDYCLNCGGIMSVEEA